MMDDYDNEFVLLHDQPEHEEQPDKQEHDRLEQVVLQQRDQLLLDSNNILPELLRSVLVIPVQ